MGTTALMMHRTLVTEVRLKDAGSFADISNVAEEHQDLLKRFDKAGIEYILLDGSKESGLARVYTSQASEMLRVIDERAREKRIGPYALK